MSTAVAIRDAACYSDFELSKLIWGRAIGSTMTVFRRRGISDPVVSLLIEDLLPHYR